MISGLPLHEKVPAIALKKLLDENQELEKQENAEIEAINIKYLHLTGPLAQRVTQTNHLECRNHKRRWIGARRVKVCTAILGVNISAWRIRQRIKD